MKKLFWFIVVILILVGIFFYVFRAPSAPSQTLTAPAVSSSTPTGTLYRIATSTSSASFTINEILHGSPFTPVGTTHDLAGDIVVSSSSVSFGPIVIDARTFQTDSKTRDGAIDRMILKAEDPANEVITFTPTSVSGAPAAITTGSALNLTVAGDLTISGVTKPETFNIAMNVGADALTGTASTTLSRADFNLVIPDFSFLAGVDDKFVVSANIHADKVAQ